MTARADTLLAEAERAAGSRSNREDRLAFHVGMLTAIVRTLCAEVADLQEPIQGETNHAKATRLLDEVSVFCQLIEPGSDGMGSVLRHLEEAAESLREVTWGHYSYSDLQDDMRLDMERRAA